MQTSIYCAIKTLLDYGTYELPFLGKDIEAIIQTKGFDIIAFDIPLQQSQSKDFDELGILNIAKTYKAFTYIDNDNKYVFYRSNLSAEEKNILLAHELGHIQLGHFASSGIRCSSDFKSKSLQEVEADEFAIELIAPTCILKNYRRLTPDKISHLTLLERSHAEHVFFKVQKHNTNTEIEKRLCNAFDIYNHRINNNNVTKKYIFMFAVIIAVCAIFIFNDRQNEHSVETHTNSIIAPIQQLTPSDTTVVVTRSGEKYHLPDCQYVKYKTNIINMTEQDALNAGYEPCSICRSDK